MVRNEEDRVQEPADSVVDGLAGTVALMTALMRNDPDTGEDQTLRKGVSGPERKSRNRVLPRGREVWCQGGRLGKVERGQGGVDVRGSQTQKTDKRKVDNHVSRGTKCRALKAVGWDGRKEILHSQVRDVELLELILLV